MEFTIVEEGDIVEVGDYKFKCIITPGHSPAHTCLYDEKTKTLIAGDMVLSNTAPILFFEDDLDDPLDAYLNSLDIVDSLDIENILPCHGDIKFDVRKRTEEIRQHYQGRCDQVTELLREKGPMTAWQTAEHTTLTEIPKELSALSGVSKWFFFLPTCMTLKYLAGKGKIKSELNSEGVNVYSV